jgi:TM2 domain-containing membrane protein YozV
VLNFELESGSNIIAFFWIWCFLLLVVRNNTGGELESNKSNGKIVDGNINHVSSIFSISNLNH